MTHKDLLNTSEYWITRIQYDFFKKVHQYMEENSLSKSELAKNIGVSKSYVTQILNGTCNFSLNKLIDISLSIGYYPQFLLAPKEVDENSKEKIEEYTSTIHRVSKDSGVGLLLKAYSLNTSQRKNSKSEMLRIELNIDEIKEKESIAV